MRKKKKKTFGAENVIRFSMMLGKLLWPEDWITSVIVPALPMKDDLLYYYLHDNRPEIPLKCCPTD